VQGQECGDHGESAGIGGARAAERVQGLGRAYETGGALEKMLTCFVIAMKYN
jgi:hypothetical protein